MDSVAPPPDVVAEAFIDCVRLLADAAKLSWVTRAGGVTSVLTEVPVATLNGVRAIAAGANASAREARTVVVLARRLTRAGSRPQAGQLHSATSTPE